MTGIDSRARIGKGKSEVDRQRPETPSAYISSCDLYALASSSSTGIGLWANFRVPGPSYFWSIAVSSSGSCSEHLGQFCISRDGIDLTEIAGQQQAKQALVTG
jgi:hypothetical protein